MVKSYSFELKGDLNRKSSTKEIDGYINSRVEKGETIE